MKEEHQKSAALAGTAFWVAAALVLTFLLGITLLGTGARAHEAVPAMAADQPRMLVPVGRAVGIKLFADGVMVVGLAQNEGDGDDISPARACGLRAGDVITHINSEEVSTIEEVRQVLQESEGGELTISAMRGEKQLQLTTEAKEAEDGTYQLGAWIRDSMAGIGTVTWYDPSTGCFGALGHGITDVDTTLLMPLQSGSIMYASVSGVQKGAQGAPGQLRGAFEVTRDMGQLSANTSQGVYGQLTDLSLVEGLEPMEVAQRSQVKVGDATILANVSGETVEEYAVKIVRVYPDSEDSRELMLEVTDPRLLEATGGIVQGMSGSPILQDGRIVGAVTHVLINDPTRGYGILAETMLETAGQSA